GLLEPRVDLLGDARPQRRVDGDERRDLRVAQMRPSFQQIAERPMRVAHEGLAELFVGQQPSDHDLDAPLRHSALTLTPEMRGKPGASTHAGPSATAKYRSSRDLMSNCRRIRVAAPSARNPTTCRAVDSLSQRACIVVITPGCTCASARRAAGG